ncbi:hypothetical protein [Tenacibaculum caenipelagi]|uniref:Immunity protein 50 of polymorphic toxin system n=1 Tax=Tenacibaculum caenipelagi TaxID=1325435 RepID=A0A4R6TGA1_9FLAO|nr:hypothetical protein [Tenacibaculum caenipelagi]TDQ27830.1 hypothetical protein DFQ07_1686 [Tenacibaculum caenipelagi]
MNEPIIIEELGLIYGRDAIFLDKIEFDETHSVKLIGEFNGSLCENVNNEKDKYIPYEISFKGILEFKMTEVDFYNDKNYISSFEKVIDSERISEFKNLYDGDIKVKDSHEHFIFHTYDDVIEIIACEFKLTLKTLHNNI